MKFVGSSAIALAFLLFISSTGSANSVRCAFAGINRMENSVHKTESKGETLYFCTKAQEKAFLDAPQQYRRVTNVGPLKATVNIISHKERADAIQAARLKTDEKPVGTHYVSAFFIKPCCGTEIKPESIRLTLTDPGKQSVTRTLQWIDSLDYYGAGFDLSRKGKYNVVLIVTSGGRDYRQSFQHVMN